MPISDDKLKQLLELEAKIKTNIYKVTLVEAMPLVTNFCPLVEELLRLREALNDICELDDQSQHNKTVWLNLVEARKIARRALGEKGGE